jgi:drug/metabolite transporter (DMT)-like permease
VTFAFVTTFVRLAYDDGASPGALILLRFSGFVAIIGGALLLRRRNLRLPSRALASTGWIALLTLVMSVAYLSSVAFIPVGLAAIILYTFPLMVGVLSSLAGREPMTAVKAIALVAAFAGLALAIGPTFSGLDLRGIGLALTAAAATAAVFTYAGPVMERYDPLVLNVYINLWMLAATALYLLLAGGVDWPATGTGYLAAAGATLCYITGFAALLAGLRFVAPVQSALMMNAEPPLSILAAALLLGERLTALQLVGVAIVLAALVGNTLGAGRPGRRTRDAAPD